MYVIFILMWQAHITSNNNICDMCICYYA